MTWMESLAAYLVIQMLWLDEAEDGGPAEDWDRRIEGCLPKYHQA
jgi:hypothetical protein